MSQYDTDGSALTPTNFFAVASSILSDSSDEGVLAVRVSTSIGRMVVRIV